MTDRCVPVCDKQTGGLGSWRACVRSDGFVVCGQVLRFLKGSGCVQVARVLGCCWPEDLGYEQPIN